MNQHNKPGFFTAYAAAQNSFALVVVGSRLPKGVYGISDGFNVRFANQCLEMLDTVFLPLYQQKCRAFVEGALPLGNTTISTLRSLPADELNAKYTYMTHRKQEHETIKDFLLDELVPMTREKLEKEGQPADDSTTLELAHRLLGGVMKIAWVKGMSEHIHTPINTWLYAKTPDDIREHITRLNSEDGALFLSALCEELPTLNVAADLLLMGVPEVLHLIALQPFKTRPAHNARDVMKFPTIRFGDLYDARNNGGTFYPGFMESKLEGVTRFLDAAEMQEASLITVMADEQAGVISPHKPQDDILLS